MTMIDGGVMLTIPGYSFTNDTSTGYYYNGDGLPGVVVYGHYLDPVSFLLGTILGLLVSLVLIFLFVAVSNRRA